MATSKQLLLLVLENLSQNNTTNVILNEDDDETEVVRKCVERTINIRKRRKRVKILNYVSDVVYHYHDDTFKSHFRMKRQTFSWLIQKLAPFLEKDGPGHPTLNPEKSLLVTLWVLANPETYRSVADRFNISVSTAVHTFDKIINVLCNVSKDFISWPCRTKMEENMKCFQKSWDFPGVIGAIDGTHIEIKMPKEHGHNYINRKGFPSIVLQAICDNKMMFIDCFAGQVGSVHDARVLRTSPLYAAISGNHDFFPNAYLIGDGGYPLMEWLIVPFKDNGHLTRHQQKFNLLLSKTRSVIERAFALLKGRFRLLKFLDMTRTNFIPAVILAACVLHNICLMSDDDGDLFISDDHNSISEESANDYQMSGMEKRNNLLAQMFNS